MTDLLFVYGTLRRGSAHPNAARLSAEAEWLGRAQLAGRLYRVDWYPALVPAKEVTATGDLFRLADPARSWPWLDAFEGCGADDPEPHEYRRAPATVMLRGTAKAAQTYLWNGPVDTLEPIASGDWLQR